MMMMMMMMMMMVVVGVLFVLYNSSLNNLEINWTSTTTPDTPVYYDISLSNVIAGREDVSYNITSINNSFVDADGTSYYPGTYDVRVRSAYGNQVPVDISLFSEWSNTITYNGIPEHKAINFSLSSYDEDDKLTRTDVSLSLIHI